jgi:hypothetical protein
MLRHKLSDLIPKSIDRGENNRRRLDRIELIDTGICSIDAIPSALQSWRNVPPILIVSKVQTNEVPTTSQSVSVSLAGVQDTQIVYESKIARMAIYP